MSEFIKSNIILYKPEKNRSRFLKILRESDGEWRIHNDTAIIYDFNDFYYYKSNDATDDDDIRWVPYSKEFAATGKFIFNDKDYLGYEPLVNFLLEDLTLEELLSNTIVMEVSW
jgi:hypothetical protein